MIAYQYMNLGVFYNKKNLPYTPVVTIAYRLPSLEETRVLAQNFIDGKAANFIMEFGETLLGPKDRHVKVVARQEAEKNMKKVALTVERVEVSMHKGKVKKNIKLTANGFPLINISFVEGQKRLDVCVVFQHPSDEIYNKFDRIMRSF